MPTLSTLASRFTIGPAWTCGSPSEYDAWHIQSLAKSPSPFLRSTKLLKILVDQGFPGSGAPIILNQQPCELTILQGSEGRRKRDNQ